jgi:glycosyltransferase involved in cell wall biosynthesis
MTVISVTAVILNEEQFLPIFLDSASRYADEIILIDGGSKDRSHEIIRSFKAPGVAIDLVVLPQTGRPYYPDWDEAHRRNLALNRARGNWIFMIDADEVIDDRIIGEMARLTSEPEVVGFGFRHVNFWGNPDTVRLDAESDPNWENLRASMMRNGLGIRYNSFPQHCIPCIDEQPIWNFEFRESGLNLYHYHYALGWRAKEGDLRSDDLGTVGGGIPKWNVAPERYRIVTAPFTGKHPEAVLRYLGRPPPSETGPL